MTKRVLVVCHSQTGQLRACAESLLRPMREAPEVSIDVVDPAPESPYPFPWGLRRFLDVFPESVLQEPPAMRPLPIGPGARYDLVVLCYQVWFLSPALPIVGFLASPQAEVLRETPVVVVGATRNMWQRGWAELKKLVEARGGRIIDHVMLVDRGPAWSTFYTTPRWMLSGQKSGGPFPPAGVSDEAIAALEEPGRLLACALRAGRLDRSVFADKGLPVLHFERRFLVPELAGKAAFRLWARTIKALGRRAPALRYPLELTFFGWLLSVLPLIPACVLAGEIGRLVSPAWYRKQVAALLQPSGGELR